MNDKELNFPLSLNNKLIISEALFLIGSVNLSNGSIVIYNNKIKSSYNGFCCYKTREK